MLGALGANIPNYVASLAAAASGQFMVGLGIILGSNIYNIAIILGISTFASKAQHGIALTGTAAKEVRVVATSTLAIMLTTLLAVGLLSWSDGDATLPLSLPVSVALLATNLLSLGLFCVLAFHALQRVPHEHHAREAPTGLITEADPLPSGKRRMAATRALGKCPDAEFVARRPRPSSACGGRRSSEKADQAKSLLSTSAWYAGRSQSCPFCCRHSGRAGRA